MEEFIQVGAISTPHGVHGEAKVYPMTDDSKRFCDLREVYLDNGADKRLLHVISCKFAKQMVILKFQEFQTPEEIDRLRKKGLYVTRDQAVPLEEGEYFIADLIGLQIENEEGKDLGVLSDVIQTGANDVYAVKTEEGREWLLPAISDCIKEVLLEEGRMVVTPLPGLLDEV